MVKDVQGVEALCTKQRRSPQETRGFTIKNALGASRATKSWTLEQFAAEQIMRFIARDAILVNLVEQGRARILIRPRSGSPMIQVLKLS
jgi:hypothetical protein